MRKRASAAHSRKRRLGARRTSHFVGPRTAEEFFHKPKKFQDRWESSLHAISLMRNRGLSLAKAAREVGISTQFVRNWQSSALRKNKRGHYLAKPTDKLLRILNIPDDKGARMIPTRDFREAQVGS